MEEHACQLSSTLPHTTSLFPMADRSESHIIQNHPIGGSLEPIRTQFAFSVKHLGFATPFEAIRCVADGGNEALAAGLVGVLSGLACLPAALLLPSRHGPGTLSADLLAVSAQLGSRALDVQLVVPFLEKVFGNATDADIWDTAYSLVSRATTRPTDLRTSTTTRVSPSDFVLHDLQKDWTSPYFPDSLDALDRLIRDFESQDTRREYYARTLVFVQSSGMGKSRLADAFGKTCPMINFVLREQGTHGFPPTDGEILSFVRMPLSMGHREVMANSPSKKADSSDGFLDRRAVVVWNHSVAVGLLQASFEKFREWVETQPSTAMTREQLAAKRHKEMAPLIQDSGVVADWGSRPTKRMEFCRLVASRAQEIAIGLVHKQDWRQIFNDTQDSRVRSKLSNSSSEPLRDLLGAAGRLRDAVLKFQCQNGDDPFLVIVLDEASSLLIGEGSGRTQAGRYVALNRIMSCLMEFRIWFFILSTESKLEALLPPSNVERVGDYTTDSSARVSLMGGSPLVPFPPFLALQLDVEDRRRMQNGEQKRIELCKPMSQFSEPKHMAMFGRPLWFAYHDAVEMNWLAKLKLVGGKQGATYNPGDEHHVFAAMSFRLSLDVCVQNPKALHLARSAVNSYMRVVVSVDQNTGVLDTVTPSEPVLAVAAMEHLCKGSNWPSSITTLIAGLLENGLIEKGLRGELYSRVVLTLAHDSVRMAALLRPGGSISRFCPRLVPTFAVKDFLIALYAKDHHESIATITPQILEARMNFTHFVPAGENLSPGVVLPLCHDLLRRNAAMQLAPAQPTYDKLLPIYFGDEGESFDLSKCGVILVQDKNKETATTPEQVFREDFTKISPKSGKRSRWGTAGSIRNGPYFVFNEMANPILFLLFDMGVATTATAATPLVQVSCSKNIATPHVWAIHSRGHTEKIFGCLETMRCERECARFFASTAPPDGSAHDRLASRNKTFHKLSRSFRYTGFDLGQEQGVGEQDDGRPGTEAEGEDKDVSMDDVQQ